MHLYATHAYSDGILIASALKVMDDRADTSTTVPVRGQQNIPWIVKQAIGLVYAVKTALYLFSRPYASNAIKKQGLPLVQDRHSYLMEPFDNKVFTEQRRKLKASYV